ncbi:MAG: hemolysin family protein [Defluviitaleaceae bacterium]|nr:hemolysin family protein [Defluviitaleaceae bacterium]
MAFASLNRARIKNMAEAGGKKGKRAALVSELNENRFDDVISTLLICNNLVAIAAATMSVALFIRLIGETWGYLISTIVISAVVIVFTDIFPKSMAKQNPENVALFCAPFVKMLMTMLTPINWAVMKLKNKMSAMFPKDEEAEEADSQTMLEQEIIFMVEEAEKEGSINEEDSLLITNAIEFNEITAWDVITPRVDIVSIPLGMPIDDIAQLFLESGYSRMPVHEDTLDNIKGVVHLRDFLRCMATSQSKKPITLEKIMTPPLYTVTSAKITELLKLLKAEKCHMAIVTDEYGGTEGMVTMDDILERLVGDIWDENDEIVEEFVDLGEGKHRILCTSYIDDMFGYFGMKAESESNTVGGWIMDQLRRIPEEGDSFQFENLRVTVTKAEERRAEECLVEIIEEAEED